MQEVKQNDNIRTALDNDGGKRRPRDRVVGQHNRLRLGHGARCIDFEPEDLVLEVGRVESPEVGFVIDGGNG